jgi:hypothetical protein
MTHPWWRPTKYTEDMISKVDEYLDSCVDWYKEVLKTRQMTDEEWKMKEVITNETVKKVSLPMIEWFASYLGVNKTTIYERAKEHGEFSNALDKITIEQKKRVVEESLSWNYNPTIAKLILSANHWMKETTVQENTWQNGWPIQITKVIREDA